MITRLTPQNFQAVSGNDKVLKFNTKNEAGEIVDLSGATIIWALAKTAKAKSTLIEYTSPTNVTITAPATDGLFQVAIQRADTEDLKGGEYYHEARLQDASGNRVTIAYGIVDLLDNVIMDPP